MNDALILFTLLMFTAAAAVVWLSLHKAAAKPTPAPVRHLSTGTCPYCGEEGIYLRLDKQPHGRYHRCVEMARAAASGWAISVAEQSTAEPNPVIPTNAA